jgi:predicted acetyltransferase
MYLHDISAFNTDFYHLDPSGRWQPDIAGDWNAPITPVENLREARLPSDEGQPFQRAHVIVAKGQPVGFACVGLRPFRYMPPETDVILAEFFLVHRSRGRGIGPKAFRALTALYAGRWTLSAIHDNARAIRFWRKTLAESGLSRLGERAVEGNVEWDFVSPP